MNNKCHGNAAMQSDITINLSSCRFAEEIHAKLKEAFGFSGHYGENWSAFWDYLDDFCGDREAETMIHVAGLNDLPKGLRSYIEQMLEIMKRAGEEYPHIHFILENQ